MPDMAERGVRNLWIRSPEYRCWQNLKDRCANANNPTFANYGGRGITVDPVWRSDFMAFLAHVGPKPSREYSLDRIDNDGNYEPGNVRWTDWKTQERNRRNVRRYEHEGRSLSLPEWAEVTGVTVDAMRSRIKNGWPVARALTQPVKPRRRPAPKGGLA